MAYYDKMADWFANKFKMPRFWTKKEWSKMTSKEKLWVIWKNWWYIKGVGSAEIDLFVLPVKDFLLLWAAIMSNISLALLYLKIEVDYIYIVTIVIIGCVILYAVNTVIQWYLGNALDKRDLPSLSVRVSEKRSRVFRRIMKEKMRQKWRK